MSPTPTSFTRQHAVMLFKYAGISFISGAVNHGFFSGERSLWTAAIGIVLFVIGAAGEHRLGQGAARELGMLRALGWGALLSIGLGFFTGGLQHFPDSPARSAWVVPLGFLLSAVALLAMEGLKVSRAAAAYVVVAGAAVAAGSLAAWQYAFPGVQMAAHDHSHGEDAGAPAGSPVLVSQVVQRTQEVRMSDAMRFSPAELRAAPGETVRLLVRNDGQLRHELMIGTPVQIEQHAQEMKSGAAGHVHGSVPGISVAPGQSGELVLTFPASGTLQIACLEPGHFEAGMKGTAVVASMSPEALPPTPAPAHDHSSHKH